MNGIHVAFTGRIGKGAEVRTARDGKPWASFPVAVDAKTDGEAGRPWVRGALFGDIGDTVAPRLTKGTQVYCEGRLSLGTWTGRDGDARAGLNLAAWKVQPMGQIGRGNLRPGRAMNMAHTTMIDGWEGRTPGPTACGVSPSANAAARPSQQNTQSARVDPTLSGITGQVAL